MKKKKLKIEIEVWGIEVEETQHYSNGNGSGWYKFEYSFKAGDKKKKFGELDGSWSSQTKKEFSKTMHSNYVFECVVNKEFN